MQPFILIFILALGAIVIGILTVVAISMRRSSTETNLMDNEMHPQGYWIGIGISMGVGFGVALGLVFDNLALGIAMGAGFGVAIGTALEKKNKDRVRSPTEQEMKMQRWGVTFGLLMLLIFAGIFAFLFFLRVR
jgi:hypothetical protein